MIELRRLPIDQLQPAPYNPRIPLKPGTPEYRRLERSLAEFDLVEPIVWNEQTGHVVGGHQRVDILKARGETDVDVSVVSLPLEREKALNVALNNRQLGSDWDPAKLVEVITELEDLPDVDATLTGFDASDIRDLLMVPQGTPPDDESLDEQTPHVVVSLEIPPEQWEDLRPDIDAFVAQHDLVVHVRMP